MSTLKTILSSACMASVHEYKEEVAQKEKDAEKDAEGGEDKDPLADL